MTALILKKTASIYGIGGGNDYTVLDGDNIIGRIFLSSNRSRWNDVGPAEL